MSKSEIPLKYVARALDVSERHARRLKAAGDPAIKRIEAAIASAVEDSLNKERQAAKKTNQFPELNLADLDLDKFPQVPELTPEEEAAILADLDRMLDEENQPSD